MACTRVRDDHLPLAPFSQDEGAAILVLSHGNTRGSPRRSRLTGNGSNTPFSTPNRKAQFRIRQNQEAWKPFLTFFTRRLLLVQTSASHRSLGEGKVTCYGSPPHTSPFLKSIWGQDGLWTRFPMFSSNLSFQGTPGMPGKDFAGTRADSE